MGKIYTSAEQLIGKTPMLRLSNIERKYDIEAAIIAKLESFNPAGSAKDRVAKAMLDDAEARGLITKDTVIIEPTSGNTGIGLASVGAARGYKTVIVMPDSMSKERIAVMKAYGAQVVLTPGALGMKGSVAKAHELANENKNSFIPSQFENPSNAKIHEMTTGPEIWEDTDGAVDVFVAGVGTGGTLTGVGRFLKSKKADVKIIAVEPSSSPLLSRGVSGPHSIQGIGANFVPDVLDTSVYDEVLTVSDESAFEFGRAVGKCEGLLVGISSGAVLSAAAVIAKRDEYKGKNIVVLLPDTGERYLSSKMFEG